MRCWLSATRWTNRVLHRTNLAYGAVFSFSGQAMILAACYALWLPAAQASRCPRRSPARLQAWLTPASQPGADRGRQPSRYRKSAAKLFFTRSIFDSPALDQAGGETIAKSKFRDAVSSQYLFEGPHKPIAFSVGSNADAEKILNSLRGKMPYQNCPAS